MVSEPSPSHRTHSVTPIDLVDPKDIPFAVAVNAFDGKVGHNLKRCGGRWTSPITYPCHVPLIVFDARRTSSVRDTLLVVLDIALSRAENDAQPPENARSPSPDEL